MPGPTCPSVFVPQHHTDPSLRMLQPWKKPAANAVASGTEGVAVGEFHPPVASPHSIGDASVRAYDVEPLATTPRRLRMKLTLTLTGLRGRNVSATFVSAPARIVALTMSDVQP